jgi:uncharacterized phage protein (predicted DNA packaging)
MKLYLRLDEEDTTEDSLLIQLIETATEYIKEATGFTFENNVPERATLLVKFLVAHWYDNRVVSVTCKNGTNVGFTVEALLNQLKYTHSEGED